MQILTRRPALRWLAPAALALAVGGTGIVATTADADPKLAPKTAEQLLVDLQGVRLDGLSGTVVQKAELGLPALPASFGGADTSQLTSLLSGSHTLRVWADGPDKARFALLDDDLGETDVIVNGSDVWTWASQENEATHVQLPEHGSSEARKARTADLPKTPQEAAELVLGAIGPSTAVTTDSAVEVANRAAHELVLTPKDAGTLISSVRIAVDGATSAPLRVQVLGQDDQTVAEVGFTSVDFATPDAAQFAFNPPPGAKVTEKDVPQQAKAEAPTKAERKAARQQVAAAKADTQVVGEGWSRVVVTKVPADAATGQFATVLNSLEPVSGSWGSGKLLAGTAFSAVLTDDGRVAVGAVEPQLLYDALTK